MRTLLGFDYGPRKIGVAVGQTLTGTASPLETLRSQGDQPDWAGIGRLMAIWQPEALVVGLPYHMDDREEAWAGRVRRFARQLEGCYRLPVYLVDERLTSLEARRYLGRQATRVENIDPVAATLILETWLGEQH